MTSDYFKLERMNQDSLYYRDGDYAVHRGINYVIGEVEKRMNELYDENEHLIKKRGELETKNVILKGENEELKQKIKELDSENEKLWETCYHTLQFARHEDITIKRNDKGHYKVYSKNVIPHDSPIISITAPSVLFNEYIINHIIEAIDKIPPVQEKEVDTDD